jgi:hypothetical protein
MRSIGHFVSGILLSAVMYVMVTGFYYEMLEIDRPFSVSYKAYDRGHDVKRARIAKDDEASFRKLATGGFCVVGSFFIMLFCVLAWLPAIVKDYETWGMRIAAMLGALYFLYYMAPIFWKGLVLLRQAFL